MSMKSIYRKLSPFQIITVSFSLLIFLGAVLLSLPLSTEGHAPVSFLDALFTSCSAVCVTGLVVKNTATFWSPFGKVVILSLIQIGGLGVVTSMIAISIFTGKRIGLRDRNLMQNAVNAPKIGGIIRFTRFLLLFTLAAEILGTVLLAIPFVRDFGLRSGLAKAVFHSISAFCNAGFDLFGDKIPFLSLVGYRGDIAVNAVIMGLIVAGGLGFMTWEDLLDNHFRWKKLRVQTRLVLVVSAVLILVPAVLFAFLEFHGEGIKTRVVLSLFQSVTTRTAGFNTANLRDMSESSRLVMIVLMMIGGSSGSTAGGLKTATIAVVILAARSFLKKKKEVGVFGRSISIRIVYEAFTLLILYLGLLTAGTVIMSAVEKLPAMDCMFECASALGTVGLSTGITPSLRGVSRILLILYMYFGRVGGLTLAFAALFGDRSEAGRLPEEKIVVG